MDKSTFVNYKKIYEDIITNKYPEKITECQSILNKKTLSVLDVIELNTKIFGKSDQLTEAFNQKHRSYKKSAILKILDYQKSHQLNNTQLAIHFKMSRNTVAKWKKRFI